MNKHTGKILAGLLSLAMLGTSGTVWAADASFTDQQKENESALFTDSNEEYESEESSKAENNPGTVFTDGTIEEGEQIFLTGLPLLGEADPGDMEIPAVSVQYLALGDSISTGYGLSDPGQSFVNLLAQQTGMTVANASADGAVSQAVLALLSSGSLDAALSDAEVVTLTIGGNDMMAAFYEMIAAAYNAASGDSITAAQVPVILSDLTDSRNAALTQSALQIVMSGYDKVRPSFSAALDMVGSNLKSIAAYIKEKNPDVTILVGNQYNPYQWLPLPYSVLGTFFGQAVNDLNSVIADGENGAGTLYTVADVYASFAASGESLTNASALPLNLDFHPNSQGHAVYASVFGKLFTNTDSEAVGKPEISQVSVTGNRVSAQLAETVENAQGYDFVIGVQENCIETKEYFQICKNQTDIGADFYYIPQGSYYVFCHAWIKGEDGIKQFGEWSEGIPVTVNAVTPQTPVLEKATVKGNTVTLTYSSCENAMGYDLVLGKERKKVNLEYRPVNYGTNVIKVKRADRLTVTFKNVEEGTYFAGLHAYNRTSEDGKKVFSYWSNTKKITIR